MKQKRILIRFGELFLKGKNKIFFIQKLKRLLQNKTKDLVGVNLEVKYDYAYLDYHATLETEVLKRLSYVSGISSFVIVTKASKNIDDIVKKACLLLQEKVKKPALFKIETIRKDKCFHLTSIEVTQKLAPLILNFFKSLLQVNVKNPEVILNIEIRKDEVYLYLKNEQQKALGGFPNSSAGKGLAFLSGGIDSPVAAYLAMKKGIAVELFHFDSSPLTPLESVQKVIDLAKILCRYATNSQIKLHLVPFRALQEVISKKVSDPYIINIMRRMMYRLGNEFAHNNNHLCLINGESVGQVASQTLESMQTTSNVTNINILRPLATMDKSEIIKIAQKIDTFDISIRAFPDCCTIYLPEKPVTRPTIQKAKREETSLDYSDLLKTALEQTITLKIQQHLDFNILDFGFYDVKEAIDNFCKQNPEQKLVFKR
ncbi:tRNA uracil 4-sulfurtransferase ThiI [Candidatus Phytoplasma solani]|uniref:Probable tRNA sulfurtransferase n=1 Tax=Candidatus Phytoplasma solani TaxID=69896 RepID=A0A421NUZ7_9MOLU|nr:tRNA uracil 4-sulfurtransferase ThiI [Candidatus Phytoplasma solani]RMI87832.1 thiamine biosynthesis protein ThiI [Candidatus Phytoplasma solani]CCP88250.1 tRNA sulfurtransferase [Candidatus Phytoplasma solani]CCP88729.1 Thiamine biosynthesis protein ThiI [Candidatus Phytoplasma solani]